MIAKENTPLLWDIFLQAGISSIVIVILLYFVSRWINRIAAGSAQTFQIQIPKRYMTIERNLRNGTITSELAENQRSSLKLDTYCYGYLDEVTRFNRKIMRAQMIVSVIMQSTILSLFIFFPNALNKWATIFSILVVIGQLTSTFCIQILFFRIAHQALKRICDTEIEYLCQDTSLFDGIL